MLPAGPGRPKGSLNKNTVAVRDLARYAAEERSEEFLIWLDRVAEKRPDRAVNAYIDLLKILAPHTTVASVTKTATAPNGAKLAVEERMEQIFGGAE